MVVCRNLDFLITENLRDLVRPLSFHRHAENPLYDLRRYTNLASINRKTHEIIEAINERDFQNKKDPRKSRKYAFETFDKPRMRPLPGGSFTPCEYKYFSRVPDSYHLEFDGHYYSVLYTYHNKPAMLKATMTEVIICDENNRYICHHERSYNEFPRYIRPEMQKWLDMPYL